MRIAPMLVQLGGVTQVRRDTCYFGRLPSADAVVVELGTDLCASSTIPVGLARVDVSFGTVYSLAVVLELLAP